MKFQGGSKVGNTPKDGEGSKDAMTVSLAKNLAVGGGGSGSQTKKGPAIPSIMSMSDSQNAQSVSEDD